MIHSIKAIGGRLGAKNIDRTPETTIVTSDAMKPASRRSQIKLNDERKPTLEAYPERKDVCGATATFYVSNILNYTEDFRRDIFDGARPDAPLLVREDKSQAFDPVVGLNISGHF